MPLFRNRWRTSPRVKARERERGERETTGYEPFEHREGAHLFSKPMLTSTANLSISSASNATNSAYRGASLMRNTFAGVSRS